MRAVSAPPLPPGVQRRKQLRKERRADRLRHLWRLLLYTAASAGLSYLLLREGWSLRQPAQVEVIGSSVVNKDHVIEAASLAFPLPLLDLNPKLLGDTLVSTLPVEQVRVRRLMLPPRLVVKLNDRTAIARAQRRTPQGVENGHVDRLGNWMAIPQLLDKPLGDDKINLRVVGWHERHQPTLIKLFENIDRISSILTEIRFEPDGNLWLETRDLGGLRLGSDQSLLKHQIQVVEHLSSSLPEQIKQLRPQSIDLSDPEQPELSLPGGIKTRAKVGRAPLERNRPNP